MKTKRKSDTHTPGAPEKRFKNKEFPLINFKVLLKDSSTIFEALQTFLKDAKAYTETGYDIVQKYVLSSSDCQEVLDLLEGNQRPPNERVQIYEVLGEILLRIATNLPNLETSGHSIVRKLLGNHLKGILSMLSFTASATHNKCALNLLVACVMQGQTSAAYLISNLEGNMKQFLPVFNRRNKKDENDVRYCALKLFVSILVISNEKVVQQLLQLQGLFKAVAQGLPRDELNSLQLVLPVIHEKIVDAVGVSKTTKLKCFNPITLTFFTQLYTWPDQEQKVTEEIVIDKRSESQKAVIELVHPLLIKLCSDVNCGITFFDKTHGTSAKNHNVLLTNFLSSLKRPYLIPENQELVIETLKACPDQLVWYLPKLTTALAPRPSSLYIVALKFLIKIYEKQPLVSPALKAHSQKILDVVKMTIANLFPPKFVWKHVVDATKDEDPFIRHVSLAMVHLVLKRLQATLSSAEVLEYWSLGQKEEFTSSLVDHAVKAFPDVSLMLKYWRRDSERTPKKKEVNKKKEEGRKTDDGKMQSQLGVVSLGDALLRLLSTLHLYQETIPDVFQEKPIDILLLMEWVCHIMSTPEGTVTDEQGLSLASRLHLKILMIVSNSDPKQLLSMKKSAGGRPLLYLLLELVVSTKSMPKANLETRHFLNKMFKSAWKSEEDDLDLWFECLANLDSAGQSGAVLDFLVAAFTRLMNDPQQHDVIVSQKVLEAAQLRSVMQSEIMGREETELDQAVDLESIMAAPEIPLSDLNINTKEKSSSKASLSSLHQSRQPFGLMIVSALRTMEKQEWRNKDAACYLNKVTILLLSQQQDPLILCQLLLQYEDHLSDEVLDMMSHWLPDKTPTMKNVTMDEGETFRTLMCKCMQSGLSLNNEIKQKLEDLLAKVEIYEVKYAVRQTLAAIKLEIYSKHKIKELRSNLIFLFELILNSVQLVNSNKFELIGISGDSKSDIIADLMKILLTHPDINLHLFTNPSDKKLSNVSEIVSSKATELILHIPSAVRIKMKYLLDEMEQKMETFLKEKSLPKWVNSQLKMEFFVVISDDTKLRLIQFLLSKQSKNDLLLTVMRAYYENMETNRTFVVDSKQLRFILSQSGEILSRENFNNLLELCIENKETIYAELASVLLENFTSYAHYINQEMIDRLLSTGVEQAISIVCTMSTLTESVCNFIEHWMQSNDMWKNENLKWNYCSLVKLIISKESVGNDLLDCVQSTYWSSMVEGLKKSSTNEELPESRMALLSALISKAPKKEKSQLSEQLAASLTSAMASHASIEILECYLLTSECIESTISTLLKHLLLRLRVRDHEDSLECELWVVEKCQQLAQENECKLLLSKLSGMWESLLKSILRNLYNSKGVFRLLDSLFNTVDKPHLPDFISIQSTYSMLISHSSFLSIMIDGSACDLKEELVKLMLTLIRLDNSCCQTSHLVILFAAYNASISNTDKHLLDIIELYEQSGCSFLSYKPFLWGEKAIEQADLRKKLAQSVWKQPGVDQVLDALDKDRMRLSLEMFPLQRKTQNEDREFCLVGPSNQQEMIYDPAFMLPLLSCILSPEMLIDCRRLVETGCLGYALVALATHSTHLRGIAYHVLCAFENQLAGARFIGKEQIAYLLEVVRYSCPSAGAKLPPLNAMFFAKMSTLLLQPGDKMYVVLNKILLRNPHIDMQAVPGFPQFFNSAEMQHIKERHWMLDLINDGLREMSDYHLLQRRQVFRMLLSFYASPLADPHSKIQILKLVVRASSLDSVAVPLVRQGGLITWLQNVVCNSRSEKTGSEVLTACCRLWRSMSSFYKRRSTHSKPANKDSLDDTVHSSHDMDLSCFYHLFIDLSALMKHSAPSLVAFKSYLECFKDILELHNSDQHPISQKKRILTPHFINEILTTWSTFISDDALLNQMSNSVDGTVGNISLCHQYIKEKLISSNDKTSSNLDIIDCFKDILFLVSYTDLCKDF